MVHQRRDLRTCGDRESGLDHAAEHHAEPERPRGVRHAHRLADAARLRELDVDPVRALRARGDVGERVAVLVDEDRHGRASLQLRATWVTCGERLLAVVDLQLRQILERLVERPVLVDVDLERTVGRGAHRAHALDVEPVSPAELELQPPEPRRGRLRAARHVVGVAEPDRPRRRRPCAAQTEQPPDRLARELPAEVVQRGVERGARGELPPRQPLEDLVERERVVAEQVRRALRRTRSPTRPTRRSGRSAPPRRSRSRRRAGARPGRARRRPESCGRSRTSPRGAPSRGGQLTCIRENLMGCQGHGDYVDDTPTMSIPPSGCPSYASAGAVALGRGSPGLVLSE